MDDDSTKEENLASTSKKEAKKQADYDDRSLSYTTGSAYSGRSRMELRADREVRPEPPKAAFEKRGPKPQDRKKKLKRGRGVVKRRRSAVRRYQPVRRAMKKKPPPRRMREGSVSTIFTRMSSRSSSNAPSCTYCGHRCCGRRCTVRKRRSVKRPRRNKFEGRRSKPTKKRRASSKRGKGRKNLKKIHKKDRNKKKDDKNKWKNWYFSQQLPSNENRTRPKNSEEVQTEQDNKLLSKLIVKSNAAAPTDQPAEDEATYLKITPDMIYESLRRLSAWRSIVSQETLCAHMLANYPVNRNKEALNDELTEKLRVAAIAGLVVAVHKDQLTYWCLSCELQQRGMTKNHVTQFWHLYGDTMIPIKPKEGAVSPKSATSEANSSISKKLVPPPPLDFDNDPKELGNAGEKIEDLSHQMFI